RNRLRGLFRARVRLADVAKAGVTCVTGRGPVAGSTPARTVAVACFRLVPCRCGRVGASRARMAELNAAAGPRSPPSAPCLCACRAGQTYVVTAHGRPIARLVPFSANEHAQPSARDALLKRLMAEPVTQAGRWARDELYEDTD